MPIDVTPLSVCSDVFRVARLRCFDAYVGKTYHIEV